MFFGFSLVLIVVVALWLYALNRKTGDIDEAYARRVTQRWIIGGGIVLPIVSIAIVLSAGIPAGHRMLPLPQEGVQPLAINVVGHRWWWEVHYPDTSVVTANELYLPVGTPVDVQITSGDVIHSFWVPKLAGKMDALPGRTKTLRIEASQAGSFRGQCAEFCGRGHAHMAIAVEARTAAVFDEWLQARQQPIEVTSNTEPVVAAFREHCGDCHRVAGVTRGGTAPDLSNIGERRFLGGRPRQHADAIAHWLKTHQTLKLGEPVPDHSQMAPQHLDEIATWLETLGHE